MDAVETLLTADQLRTVLAIGRTGSFTRAAAELELKQPAVTQQVRRLEEKFQRKLFTRSSGGSTFTVDGEALLIYARAMQKLGRNLSRHFNENEKSQTVRIGLNEDFVRRAFPAVLGLFAREHPTIQLNVACGDTKSLEQGFDNDEFDVVITRRYSAGSRGRLLWTERTTWVGRSSLPSPVADPIALVLPPAGGFRNAILSSLTEHGRSWRSCFESWSLTSLEVALRAGLGISAFPSEMALSGLVHLDATAANLPALPGSEVVYHQATRADSPVVDTFCAILVEAARLAFSEEAFRSAANAIT